ncbi:hypothetical protein [Undibacterium sp. Di24W]|uniref:hypothetical protein n=1 Tax=Undibacterium sp. Di24W TaxID=3413033 RepID=UPI003BF15A57
MINLTGFIVFAPSISSLMCVPIREGNSVAEDLAVALNVSGVGQQYSWNALNPYA